MSILQALLDSYSAEHSIPEEGTVWELTDYTTEALLADQSRVFSLLDVVNGLSTSFESGTLSVQDYTTQVDIAFKSGGLILPLSVITPSLEAADNSEKKKNVFMRMIDYILAKLKQFYQWFFYGSKPMDAAKKTLDGDFKEFNTAKDEAKKKPADKDKSVAGRRSTDTSSDKPNAPAKAYLSSEYISGGIWDYEKYKTVYRKLVTLNETIQRFDPDKDPIDQLDKAFKEMAEYSALIKKKDLAEIADVDSLVVQRLETTVSQGMEIEMNRYLKELDSHTREIIKSYESEVKRLQTKAANGEDVGEELEKSKTILHTLTVQTKMGPFLSAMGTMIKDGTKILKAVS